VRQAGAASGHHRRDVAARWRRCVRTSRVLTCSSGSADPEACSPPQPQVRRGEIQGGSGRATTTSAPPPSRRLRHRRRAPHRRPRLGDNVFFAATGITDGDLLQGCATRLRRHTQSWCCARARGRCGRSTPSTRSQAGDTASCTESRNGSAQRGRGPGPLPAAQQAAGRRRSRAQFAVERRGDVEQLEVDLGSSSAPLAATRLPDPRSSLSVPRGSPWTGSPVDVDLLGELRHAGEHGDLCRQVADRSRPSASLGRAGACRLG